MTFDPVIAGRDGATVTVSAYGYRFTGELIDGNGAAVTIRAHDMKRTFLWTEIDGIEVAE